MVTAWRSNTETAISTDRIGLRMCYPVSPDMSTERIVPRGNQSCLKRTQGGTGQDLGRRAASADRALQRPRGSSRDASKRRDSNAFWVQARKLGGDGRRLRERQRQTGRRYWLWQVSRAYRIDDMQHLDRADASISEITPFPSSKIPFYILPCFPISFTHAHSVC